MIASNADQSFLPGVAVNLDDYRCPLTMKQWFNFSGVCYEEITRQQNCDNIAGIDSDLNSQTGFVS